MGALRDGDARASGGTQLASFPQRMRREDSRANDDSPEVTPERTDIPLIEVGWIEIDALSAAQQAALAEARRTVLARLSAAFPRFEWRMPNVVSGAFVPRPREEPARCLEEGAREREVRGWDFALVVTGRDLRSYYKSHALAVPSRALSVAVLSLARMLPSDESEAGSQSARRVAALVLHLFGDLNGLWHREETDAVMRAPRAIADLDTERSFDESEREALADALSEVADLRLEERDPQRGALAFYALATFERCAEIGSAVLQARPWEIPLRLTRLTAAALSALFILLVTAEVWDLGTRQSPSIVCVLSSLVVCASTSFILLRQRLLLRRARGRFTEQAVVTNVSATLIVLGGMLTTYLALFGSTLAIGFALFEPSLVSRWAPDLPDPTRAGPILVLAGLVSSLGLLIGALGASFEGEHYIRHVIYADEET